MFFIGDYNKGGYFDSNSGQHIFDFTGRHREFVEDIPSTESQHYKWLIVYANKNTYYDNKNTYHDNKNKKYVLIFDDANNLIGASQNILDEKGQI